MPCVEATPPRKLRRARTFLDLRHGIRFAYIISGVSLAGMLGALFSVLFTPGVDPGAVTSAALLLAAGLGILLGAESIYRRRRSAFVKGSICRGEVKVLFRRRRIYRSRREIYARIEFEDQNGGLFATAAPAEGTGGSNKGNRSDARSPDAGNLAVGDSVLVAWDADSRTAFPLVSQVGTIDICEDS